VDQNECVGCGLCAARCPFGAIGIGIKGAHVNDKANRLFVDIETALSPGQERRAIAEFTRAPHSGTLVLGGESNLLGRCLQRLGDGIAAIDGSRFIRNAMITAGVPWRNRRSGDAIVRIDAVFEHAAGIGTAEVEFSEFAALESPRAILDNIAVLHARYKQAVASILPLIVTLALPNRRSEFYRVIADCRKVLGIDIRTVTVGAIILLIWERRAPALEAMTVNEDSPSIRPQLEKMLGRTLAPSHGCSGLATPFK
jgi:ferredoxin